MEFATEGERVDESGVIETIIEDHPARSASGEERFGKSEHRFFLVRADGRKIRLEIDRASEATFEGARAVRVLGRRRGDTLGLRGADLEALDVLEPRSQFTQALSGPAQRKVAMVMVKFAGDADTFTRSEATTALAEVQRFYAENSFGSTRLSGKTQSAPDVFGWLSINAATASGCDTNGWTNSARTAASAAGIDLTGYEHVIYAMSRVPGCSGWAGLGHMPGGWVMTNGRYGANSFVLAHELGHNFGFAHAATTRCTSGGSNVPLSSSCTVEEYGDPHDVMGGSYRLFHTNAGNKARAGWIPALNLAEVRATGDFTLLPLETSSTGKQVLRVVRPSGEPFFVEFRRPFGFDGFASTSPAVRGVSVRMSAAAGSPRTKLLDMTPASASFDDAALLSGQTFTDPDSGIRLQVTSATESEARVRVTFPGGGAGGSGGSGGSGGTGGTSGSGGTGSGGTASGGTGGTGSCAAQLFQHCAYGGYAVCLARGTYRLADLRGYGMLDNDVSSLKVNTGVRATLYASDGFSGTSIVKAVTDYCLVDDNFNDQTTSVRVE
jgi:hypothetical protein